MQWNQKKNVAMIYRDGIRSTDDDDDEKKSELEEESERKEKEREKNKNYFDFVQDIYDEIEGNKWFDKFVQRQYRREISIWRHSRETARTLANRQAIIDLLLEPKIVKFLLWKMENIFMRYGACTHSLFEQKQDLFTALDLNDNGVVDIHELKIWIQNQGYRCARPKDLDDIFNEIDVNNDGQLTVKELKKWRHEQRANGQNGEREPSNLYVHYEKKVENNGSKVIHRYEFSNSEQSQNGQILVAKLYLSASDDDVRWAVFRQGLPEEVIEKFDKRYQKVKPKPQGYWMVITDDETENTRAAAGGTSLITNMLGIDSLRKMHCLLHEFYTMTFEEHGTERRDHALYQLICNKEDSDYQWGCDQTNFEIRFVFDDDENDDDDDGATKEEYRLTWWNEKGQHDPNAFSIIKISEAVAGDEEANKQELHYIRFSLPPKLEWQWYSYPHSLRLTLLVSSIFPSGFTICVGTTMTMVSIVLTDARNGMSWRRHSSPIFAQHSIRINVRRISPRVCFRN